MLPETSLKPNWSLPPSELPTLEALALSVTHTLRLLLAGTTTIFLLNLTDEATLWLVLTLLSTKMARLLPLFTRVSFLTPVKVLLDSAKP